MKKIFLLLLIILTVTMPSYSAARILEEKVSAVGARIISANSLPATVIFKVVNGVADNSDAISTNIVQISAEDLTYAVNDNEVAYIAAYELGCIINDNITTKKEKNKIKTNTIAKETYIRAADIMGIDLMINGGYNPLAGIAMLTKMPDVNSDTLQNNPLNSSRAMHIYDYLTYNFPSKLKIGYSCNEYNVFLKYIEPILECRNSDKKKLAKFNKEQEKLNSKRAKQFAKYKPAGSLANWDISYELLISITEAENK